MTPPRASSDIRLAPGVHAASSGEGLIFLDLRSDTYLCARTDDHTLESALIERDLATANPAGEKPWLETLDVPVWEDSPDIGDDSLSMKDVFFFLRAMIATAWTIRRATVDHLAEAAGHLRPATAASPDETPARIAARFERLWLFLPRQPRCLFRCFALLHFLRLYGQRADWVFGVSLYPFRAHCWLAVGCQLIGERSNQVAGFSPILTVKPTIS